MKRSARAASAIVASALIAGCGGGGGTPSGAMNPPQAPSSSSSVRVLITVPAAMKSPSSAVRKPHFVSPSTNGVLVKVYAASDTQHATVLGTSATDVSPGSAACGGATTFPRTCSIVIPAPAGADSFVFTTYDRAPSGGAFTGAPQLGAGIVSQTIAAGQTNTVSVTLGGVLASVTLSLATPVIKGIGSSSQTLTVTGLDADGNAIVSDGYVDSSGNPVSIALSQSVVDTAGGAAGTGTTTASGANGGTVTLGSASLSQPASSSVTVSYDGGATLPACSGGPCDGTFTDTISAKIGSASSAAGMTTLKLSGPKLIEYALPASAGPWGMTAGSDGNVWFTEPALNNIASITPSGQITQYPVPTANANPYEITSDSSGNLWFSESTVDQIGKSTTTGSIGELGGLPSGAHPDGIAYGSDGHVWYTEAGTNQIGTFIPSTGAASYSSGITSGAMLRGMTAGPDGNLWFAEFFRNKIGKITTSGTVTEYSVTSGGSPYGITAGPDGNLWFTETNGNRIGKITTSGTVTEYATPTVSAGPQAIASGPDGNLWFVEYAGNKVGRITTSGIMTEYAGMTASAGPAGIVAGADGNLWFTEHQVDKIGELVR